MNSPIEKIDRKTKSVSVIVPLEFPITVTRDGKQIQVYQLEINRLKVKHLKTLPSSFLNQDEMSPSEARLVIIAFTNLSQEEADEIDLQDSAKIIGVGRDLLK